MATIASRFSSDRARGDGATERARLQRLAAVDAGRHRVVTCYQKLEPRDRSRGKYLIKLKNRVKEVVQALPRLGLDHAAQHEVIGDLERIQTYLRNPGNLPSSQGIALFACQPIGLFEAIPLPFVYRSRIAVDIGPLVRELASVEDEFGRILTVVLDRTAARFFEVTAYEAVELPGLRADSTRGKRFRGDEDGPPGWGEHTYNNRIRTEKQRHLEAIARELFAIDRRRPAHGIVLAGTGSDAAAVEPFLHNYLVERVIGTAKINPKEATPARVHESILTVREAWERDEERNLVREMQEALGSGWSLNGMTPTLRALSRGQVRALLVHADAGEPGFRCSGTSRLALTERDCRGEGDLVPVLDVVDDAIEEALRQGVDVNVVYEPDAREAIEGLAGLLRFR